MLGLTAVPFEVLARNVPGLTGELLELGKREAGECFKGALDWVYLLTVPFGIVAVVAAACMGDVEGWMDGRVAVVLS